MDSRVVILTVPSLAVLVLLVVHSLRTLPRRRAIAFWCSVTAYGVLRGLALRFVIAHGGGSSFPYSIRDPLFPVFGVPLQELAGWAVVGYLGWWLGSRFTPRLSAQAAWACLFLGAISWAVETAAVAAGWWSWTIPVTNPLFAGVPFIAIVDWFFVGTDFLLPFMALGAPALRHRPARFVALLAFPLHFGSHCFSATAIAGIPVHHLAHWLLLGVLLTLAVRSETDDKTFVDDHEWLPLVALAIVLLDAAFVDLVVAKQPRLLPSLLPAITLALHSFAPAAGYAAGVAAILLGAWKAPFAVAGLPTVTAGFLTWGRHHRRLAPAAGVVVLVLVAAQVHSSGGRARKELTHRLDAAIAARDRGDLDGARRELSTLTSEFAGSHVPPALLGEIEYKTDHLDAARTAFERVVAIKQDEAESYRYLAVIELRSRRPEAAAAFAAKGLEVAAYDPELAYLGARARSDGTFVQSVARPSVARVQTLAALAFEVGDIDGAAALLDRGLAQWPEERAFYPSRMNVAMKKGDDAVVHRVVALWRTRFPEDAEARQLSQRLGME